MTYHEFNLAADLANITPNAWRFTAARMVLVEGLSHAEAARRCLISRPTVTVAVNRIKQTIAQAQELAASINQQEEP